MTLFVAGGCGRESSGLVTDSGVVRGRGGAAPAFDVEVCTSLRTPDRQTDSEADAAAGGFYSCCGLEINILTA